MYNLKYHKPSAVHTDMVHPLYVFYLRGLTLPAIVTQYRGHKTTQPTDMAVRGLRSWYGTLLHRSGHIWRCRSMYDLVPAQRDAPRLLQDHVWSFPCTLGIVLWTKKVGVSSSTGYR